MKKYFKIVKKEIIFRLFFHLIYMCAIAALPYIIKFMIDCGFAQGYRDVLKWTGLFVLAIVIGMASQYISQRSAWKLDEKFYKHIRKDYFNHVISKTPQSFEEKSIGEYSSEIMNNIESCEEYIEYCMQICESIIGLTVYAIYIFLLDIRIAIVIYLTALITLFLPRITGKKLSNKKQTLLNDTGEYTNKVMDLLKGFPFVNLITIKSMNREHVKHLNRMENARFKYGSFKTFTNVLNGSVMYVVNIAAFAIIAVLLCAGSITAGIATATISYIQDFMYPLRTIIDSVSNVKSVEGVKNDMMNQIANCRTVKEKEVVFHKKIAVKNISISFQDSVIKEKSFTFEKGKSYVIVGDSGTGKSTLLKIIAGRMKADEGQVFGDEEELDYDSCNQIMFYSNQDSHIYDASYEDNVTVFESYHDKNNYDVLNILADYKYIKNTQNCNELSGGEKQIVLLNRALYSNREVLILDEPCSAMNEMLEYNVTEYLLSLGKMIIMVTHNNKENYLNLFDYIIEMK